MKAFLYFLSKTDTDIIRHCPSSTRQTHLTLGFFVLMTGILAFISGSFAISNMFVHENAMGRPQMTMTGWILSPLIGIIYAAFIVAIDREIVSATTRWAVIFRLPLAIAITLIVSLPVELQLFESKLLKQLTDAQKNENDSLAAKLNETYNTSHINARIQKLENLKDGVITAQVYWANIKEKEARGSDEEGRTGKAGRGTAYYEADSNLQLNIRLANKYEQEIQQQKADLAVAFNKVQVEHEKNKGHQSYDLLSRYIALSQLKDDPKLGSAVSNMSWGITALFLLFELIPSIMKLLLPKTEYDELLNNRRMLNITAAKFICGKERYEYEGLDPKHIEEKNPLVVQAMYSSQALK